MPEERADSWHFYRQALISDLSDIQGGTTAEGIHLGVMGGCLKGVVTNFAGLDWHNDPFRSILICRKSGNHLKFSVLIRGDRYHIEIIGDELKLRVSQEVRTHPQKENVVIAMADHEHVVAYDTEMAFKVRP
jgi:alpha,alpha-trehalase